MERALNYYQPNKGNPEFMAKRREQPQRYYGKHRDNIPDGWRGRNPPKMIQSFKTRLNIELHNSIMRN
eukprot:12690240-Prorocentrum_lima.AAC.1